MVPSTSHAGRATGHGNGAPRARGPGGGSPVFGGPIRAVAHGHTALSLSSSPVRHFWLDRILHLEPGVRASGVKAVALAEDQFDAHFPGNPVLPGVYLLEGLAQTAGVLIHQSIEGRLLAVLVSIERARFLAFARPGDQ